MQPPWNLLASPSVLQKALSLQVLSFSLTTDSLFAIVLSGTDNTKTYSVTIRNGKCLCSHEFGSLNSQLCSHAIASLMEAAKENDISLLVQELLTETKIMTEPPYIRVPDLAGFNSLVGGLPIGALFGVYGAPQTNKSILFTQMAWTLFPFGTNALLIDTEGSAGAFSLNEWVNAFNKKLKSNVKIVRISYDTDTATF